MNPSSNHVSSPSKHVKRDGLGSETYTAAESHSDSQARSSHVDSAREDENTWEEGQPLSPDEVKQRPSCLVALDAVPGNFLAGSRAA